MSTCFGFPFDDSNSLLFFFLLQIDEICRQIPKLLASCCSSAHNGLAFGGASRSPKELVEVINKQMSRREEGDFSLKNNLVSVLFFKTLQFKIDF